MPVNTTLGWVDKAVPPLLPTGCTTTDMEAGPFGHCAKVKLASRDNNTTNNILLLATIFSKQPIMQVEAK
jgi:hypothetical protein